MIAALLPPDVLAQAALLAGVAGVVLVAWGAPRRSSPAALALWLGFTALAASGVLGMGAIPDLDAGWSAALLFVALLGLGLAGGLAILEFRSRAKALLLAMSETETLRREVARLSGINVRVEDEARDLRRQIQAGIGARSGQQALLEATVAHLRQALDTSTQALRRQRSLFDGAVEGMAVLERETLRLSEVNPGLCRLTGRTAEELTKIALLDLFPAGPQRPGKADLQRAARESRALNTTVERKEGHSVPVEVTVAAVGEGEEARLVVVLRDATERRTAERDADGALKDHQERVRRVEDALHGLEDRNRNLEAANSRLADLQERKDQQLASVAHELRTPLTSIRSFSEILLKHEDAEPEIRREFLGIVQRESERLTRLVNNVLDLARIEAGAAKLTPSEFDARVLLTDAIAAVQGSANEARVTIRVQGLGELLTMRADRDRVQQILVNLIANAVKYSPEGGEVEASVAGDGTGGPVRFEIRDHGRGIPTEQLPHIFDRFHRIEDGASPPRSGTGLGLAISKEIVALHGGKIDVESQPGRGSTFRVEFPGLAEARDRTAARVASAEPVAAPIPVLPMGPVSTPVFATPPGPVVATPSPVGTPSPVTPSSPPTLAATAPVSGPAPVRTAAPGTKEPTSKQLPPIRETPSGRTLPSRRALDLMSTTGTLPPIGG